jgi:hypothetical protein
VIGKEEEYQQEALEPQTTQQEPHHRHDRRPTNHYVFIQNLLKIYQQSIDALKKLPKSEACSHLHSCFYYALSGGTKLFSIGLMVQLTLKLILQSKKIIESPSRFRKIMIAKDTLKIGGFLGGFTLIYRVSKFNEIFLKNLTKLFLEICREI